MTLREKLRATMTQPHWLRESERCGFPVGSMVVAGLEDLITDVEDVFREQLGEEIKTLETLEKKVKELEACVEALHQRWGVA